MKNRTKAIATAGTAAVAYLAALAPAGQAATVCNEAENSHRGGYEVSGGIVDPKPPAFLRGSQMRVGNDGSRGLANAADRSPALRQCASGDDDGGGGGDLPT
ncbi:MAG TPA: hypothetical protein VIZ61_01145 [Solirubrobacterales bacterium]